MAVSTGFAGVHLPLQPFYCGHRTSYVSDCQQNTPNLYEDEAHSMWPPLHHVHNFNAYYGVLDMAPTWDTV